MRVPSSLLSLLAGPPDSPRRRARCSSAVPSRPPRPREPAGVYPDAVADPLSRELAVQRRVLHLHRRPQGVGGMCRVRYRDVERGEDRVSLELRDDATVAFQDSTITSKYSLRSSTMPAGPSVSVSVVKPSRSQNSTVASDCSGRARRLR